MKEYYQKNKEKKKEYKGENKEQKRQYGKNCYRNLSNVKEQRGLMFSGQIFLHLL